MKKFFVYLCLVFLFTHNESPFADEGFEAGFAVMEITPPVGVPLAGYGGGDRRLVPWDILTRYEYATFLKPSTGIMDPIRSKVLVLKKGDEKVAFVSLDLVGFTKDMRERLLRITRHMGFEDRNLIVSATHTHSGPGTLNNSFIWEILASDLFQRRVSENLLLKVAQSINIAQLSLQDAELYASSFRAQGLQKNRRGRPGHFDPQANLLLVKSRATGEWMGAMVNLPVHPTALGTDNHHYSADVAGAIEYATEDALSLKNKDASRQVSVLFMNGAEGDVGPTARGQEGMREIGISFAAQAMETLSLARRVEPLLEVKSIAVKLPRAGLNVRGCVQQNFLRALILKRFRLFLGFWLHRRTTLWNIRIGDMMMMSWPGEPTTSLGLELKQAALNAGAEQAWVLGLTNDYMGYFTTRDEYFGKSYEACSTLHTEKGGAEIIGKHKQLLMN